MFKSAVAAMPFRRNPFKNQRSCLRPKRFRPWRDAFLLFLFYIILLPPADAKFAQSNQNDSLIVGSAAPTFFLRNLNGGEFYLSDYCGKLREPWKNKKPSVVVLSFFATWCEPCLKEIAALEEIAATFAGQDLKIFLIAVNEKPELVTAFVKKHGFKIPVLLDTYGLVAQKYGADKLPRYALINKDGKITLLGKGYTAGSKLKLSKNLTLLFSEIAPGEVRLAK
jgi:peroxiredoxin